MRTAAWSGVFGVLVAAHVFSCGSGSDGGGGGSSGSSGSSSGGAAGSASGGTSSGGVAGTASGGIGNVGNGGSGGTGNTGNTGGTGNAGGGGFGADAGIPDVTFTYDGPVEQDGSVDACAVTSVKADPAPLDMYIMFDNSGSMGLDCNLGSGGTSKWCYSITALDQFFKSAPAGTGVALQYFPKCWNPATVAQCTSGAACAIPEVALAQLPGNLNPLEASLNANAPLGTTPMEAALHGLATFTTQNKQSGRVMIGIFITDGTPEACTTNVNTLSGIIQTHLTTDKIKTFVIGMTGADDNQLNTMAAPGGAAPHSSYCGSATSPCYHYNVGAGNPSAFTAVLQSIQQSAVACQFAMPKTDAGIVDPTKIEVSYCPGGNCPGQKLGKVDDATKCTGAGGWYYDNNANPTSISLCPSSCSVVQVDSNAKINVSLGCLGS